MTEQEEFEFRLRLEREQKAAKPSAKPGIVDSIKEGAGNLVAGAVRGAGSIGATILAPRDALESFIARKMGAPELQVPDRRKAMDEGLQAAGADPDSLLYKGGKLAGEIAGTAGAGGAIAGGLARVPGVAAAAPNMLQAIRTAGMSAGPTTGATNALLRAGGGAVSGGVSAGMVNPEDTATGAVIGGALPGALKVAGLAGKVVGAAGRGLGAGATNVLGLSTGVGAEPIRQAFKAGANRSQEFVDNMRGNVPLTDVLEKAKSGLSAMREAKSAQYRSGMLPIQGDKTVLNFSGIDKALSDAAAVTSYKGQVKNEAAASAVQKMREVVDEWKALDPAQFHTPEGLDALKQKLSGIMESIPFEQRTARLAAGKVYSATKNEIQQQAPAYAKVMKDYTEAAEQIQEIERALSLGDKAAKDTAMRKLQSLMRNNVQTNYGNRLNLANSLEQQGGVEIMPDLAGQALNSATPRSLSGQLGAGTAVLSSMASGNPLPLLALPFQSPRAVGEAAYQFGRLTNPLYQTAQGGRQQLGANALARLSGQVDPVQFVYRSAPVLMADR